MKKYILAASVVAASLTLPSCGDDFLDVVPPTQISADEYFSTEAHLEELLISAYTPLFWFDYSQGTYSPLNITADVMADDIYVGGETQNDMDTWHLMARYKTYPDKVNNVIWVDCYNGVRRCNYVFQNIPTATDLSEDTKNRMLAEAYILRAYYYSIVWKFWGHVPYYTENLVTAIGKTPADEVYANIITDLEAGLALNKLPMRETGARLGRVTKAMAYMVYADVVMYQKDQSRYATALGYMKEIINSGDYDLFADFDAMWAPENEQNQEVIFAVGYFNQTASRSWGNPYYVGGSVTPTLISPHSLTAGTECNGVAFVDGWGFAPVRQEAYDAFEEGDLRRDGTINDFRDNTQYKRRYQDTGLWLRKYAARQGGNDGQIADAQLNFGNDLVLFRYAETLLNAAELVALGAGDGDAQGWLDKVRSRAGLGSVSPTVDNIINERRFEFMGEGKRYFDLIRSGKAASVLVPDEYGRQQWTENKKYLPIAQSEINSADGQLEQYTEYGGF